MPPFSDPATSSASIAGVFSMTREPSPVTRSTCRAARTQRRPRIAASRSLFAMAGLLALAGAVAAQPTVDEPRIDAKTGRDVAVYAPDRLFDHLHMKLVVNIPTMSEPHFDGVETLTVTPIGVPRTSLLLDAGDGLKFSTITVNGSPAEFDHKDAKLTIQFPQPLAVGQIGTIVMTYHADKPGGKGKGFTWSKDNSSTPEEDFMFHSQGQPETNHLWFPCHDFPNERLTTEVIATVPKGYEALSNGHIVEVKKFSDGRTRFHWLQDKVHTNYLVSLIVSKFDVVNVGGPNSKRPGLWMPVYGPLGSGEHLRTSYGNTPEMVAMMEKLFDEPYPWDKYSQAIARDFAAGAMENTSCTTFAQGMGTSGRSSIDGIIVHELCHQWFGDLCAYKGWEHTWLGEGWANYSEALWSEHQSGKKGYENAILAKRGTETGSQRWYPRFAGMATNRYTDPDDRFMQIGRDWVYNKGGFVLHMLRQRLGDEVFWKGVALYIDRFKYKCAETDDFRKALEDASGQSLERFFEQWVRRPGFANLAIDYEWDEDSKMLKVVVEQTQKIDGDNPAFAFSLPLDIKMDDDKTWEYVDVIVDTKKTEQSFKLSGKPKSIAVDPNVTVFMKQRVRQPLAAWLDVLEHGRTLYAQWQAVEALGEFDEPAAKQALTRFGATLTTEDAIGEMVAEAVAAIDLRAGPKHPTETATTRR